MQSLIPVVQKYWGEHKQRENLTPISFAFRNWLLIQLILFRASSVSRLLDPLCLLTCRLDPVLGLHPRPQDSGRLAVLCSLCYDVQRKLRVIKELKSEEKWESMRSLIAHPPIFQSK